MQWSLLKLLEILITHFSSSETKRLQLLWAKIAPETVSSKRIPKRSMNPSKNAPTNPSELGAMVSEWHICALTPPSQLSPNSLPGKISTIASLLPPCPPPAHPVSYTDSGLLVTQVSQKVSMQTRSFILCCQRVKMKTMLLTLPSAL